MTAISDLSGLSGPQLLLAIYYLILGTLAAYGVHRLALVALYYRTRRRAPEPPPEPAEWPRVTVQLPLYNEMYVAERLIDAAARLDYPPEPVHPVGRQGAEDQIVECQQNLRPGQAGQHR